MPVDPLVMNSRYTVDATGHDAVVASTLVRKAGIALDSQTGAVGGEKPMWAQVGEKGAVDCTKEVFKGFVVCGMAANAVGGAHRMGPIFGGMLNSGKKAARLIQEGLRCELSAFAPPGK